MNTIQMLGLIASFGAVFAAVTNGIFTMLNTGRINANTGDVEELKGAIGRDMEFLKSRLEHDRRVSSTQWDTEFRAYEALWKSLVLVRGLALKLVQREGELSALGLRDLDISEAERIEAKKVLLERYTKALVRSMQAINDRAPFYAKDIREAANKLNGLGNRLRDMHLAAMVSVLKGQSVAQSEVAIPNADAAAYLRELLTGIDEVEGMIRERLNAVRVIPIV